MLSVRLVQGFIKRRVAITSVENQTEEVTVNPSCVSDRSVHGVRVHFPTKTPQHFNEEFFFWRNLFGFDFDFCMQKCQNFVCTFSKTAVAEQVRPGRVGSAQFGSNQVV